MNIKLKNYLISLLRKGTYIWKPRSEAKKKARVQIGAYSTGRPKWGYLCAICGNIFKDKETVSDHIDPVVPIDGFKLRKEFDLHEYAERMFCEEEGFQCLCKTCHDIKSKKENEERRANKSKE